MTPPATQLDLSQAPAPMFPAGLVVKDQRADADQLAALAANWRMEYVPLERGPFYGEMNLVHTARAQVATVEYSGGFSFRGRTPPHTVTFVAVFPGRHPGVYLSRPVDSLEVFGCAGNVDTEFFTPTHTKHLSLSVARSVVEQISPVLAQRALEGDPRFRLRFVDEAEREHFISRMCAFIERIARRPECLTDPSEAPRLERNIVESLLNATLPHPAVTSRARRHHIALMALDDILKHRADGFDLRDLCDRIGANERTLLLGFSETFGTAPKAFLKTLRLIGARRELREAKEGSTVTEVAVRHGFLHFGRFAGEYRAAFGENPSETLRGCRAAQTQ